MENAGSRVAPLISGAARNGKKNAKTRHLSMILSENRYPLFRIMLLKTL
jgi:hypothetical protein